MHLIRTRLITSTAAMALISSAACLRAADATAPQEDSPATVISPTITMAKGPIEPLVWPDTEQSVIFEHSPHMINRDARPSHPYEPIEDGGFCITGGTRTYSRHINQGHNRVFTGDAPRFRVNTPAGNGCYMSDNRTFGLFARPDASKGDVSPSLGELRLAIPQDNARPLWLDEVAGTTARFYPGYTLYDLHDPDGKWNASITIVPARDVHGFICKIEFDRDMPLTWQFGNIWYKSDELHANKVAPDGHRAVLTDSGLPNGEVVIGWTGDGMVQPTASPAGQQAQATSVKPQRIYYVIQTWGVSTYDKAKADEAMARLDNANTKGWNKPVKHLQDEWFNWMIAPAFRPQKHYADLAADPDAALQKAIKYWGDRRAEFQIRTPDPYLTALINWSRCISEYHRQGPGLQLGTEVWAIYSHISVGWYGKEWGGDHQAIEDNLRFYAAYQRDDGYINWVSEALMSYGAEDNTSYWVDQVWRHYRWTGDRQFLADMWPHVQRAMKYVLKGDPDGDGLHRAFYEYWNADSNGKGPKAAAPTSTAWMAFSAAAEMAKAMQDPARVTEYEAAASRIRGAAMSQLWRNGRLGSIGSDEIWRGHSQIWEQYLAINAGMLKPEQSRSALRWMEAHLGYEPNPGIRLLTCSDLWPLRWSVQWVATGDTCLAIQAGMRNGDTELWWPYLQTLAKAPFQDDGGGPGIRMAVNNFGCAGGEREDVDSDDPHNQVVVRGLFGIEPAVDQGKLDILPAFPATWTHASITTPDLSYDYQREGDVATFTVRSPRPLIKHIRANFGGEEIITPAETSSTVKLKLALALAPPTGASTTIRAKDVPLKPYRKLTPEELKRQIQIDLRGAYNQTLEQLTSKTAFTFDCNDGPSPISGWWSNPKLRLPPSPAVVKTGIGVTFLTQGRVQGQDERPEILALSSWKPNPLPASASIPVNLHCERIWLLMQNYVHPMRCYVPNGEIVLHYADGTQGVTSLVPPYNLDCCFQQFALDGMDVPLGEAVDAGPSWMFISERPARARAQLLQISSDPAKAIQSIEIRATCGEGVIGLTGLTLLEAP